jgi:hypothetical protein
MKTPYHWAARRRKGQLRRVHCPKRTAPGKSRKGKEEGEAVSGSAAGAEGGYLLANRGLNSAPPLPPPKVLSKWRLLALKAAKELWKQER